MNACKLPVVKVFLFFFLSFLLIAPLFANEKASGVLLLAHGLKIPKPNGEVMHIWNKDVEKLAAEINQDIPIEVAFSEGDPEEIQKAVNALQARGITRIIVVPFFVMTDNPIVGNSRYILGLSEHLHRFTKAKHLDRVQSDAAFYMTSALEDHELISEILLMRAQDVTHVPSKTTVILISYGSKSDEMEKNWAKLLGAHADYLKAHGGFRDVKFATTRGDAKGDVKHKARRSVRELVEEEQGERVVIPFVISASRLERSIKQDLQGLDFQFGKSLAPHPLLKKWIEQTYLQALASKP